MDATMISRAAVARARHQHLVGVPDVHFVDHRRAARRESRGLGAQVVAPGFHQRLDGARDARAARRLGGVDEQQGTLQGGRQGRGHVRGLLGRPREVGAAEDHVSKSCAGAHRSLNRCVHHPRSR